MSIFDIFKRIEKSRDDEYSASGSPEFIICGLGNPGVRYENTRHNCGFMAVDKIAEKSGHTIKKLKFKSLTETIVFGGRKCLLMKPTTFMNLSGEALNNATSFFKIPPKNTIIIFDDINSDVGNIKIKRGGSDGGHNGMKNIIYLSGSDEFPRIKIGAGNKPHKDYPLADWVTSTFKKEEGDLLLKSLDNAVKAAEFIVNGEIEKAMNAFNSKTQNIGK